MKRNIISRSPERPSRASRAQPFPRRDRREGNDRRARALHRSTLADLGDHIVLLLAADGRIVDVNEHAPAAYGYTREELLQMRIGMLRAADAPSLDHLPDGASRYETEHRRKDGDRMIVEVMARPIGGAQRYVQEIVRDISRQKLAEREILASDEKFRALLEGSTDAVAVACAGVNILVNGAYVALFGYQSADEIVGRPVADMIAPRDRSRVTALTSSRAAGRPVPAVYLISGLRKDGSEFDLEVRGTAITFDGAPCTMAIVRDVTARQRAEKELLRVNAELELFFDTAVDLLCIADLDGYFRRVNREWEKVLGFSVEELEGSRFLDYVHPEDLPATMDAIGRLGDGRTVLAFVNRYRAKDGSLRSIEWRATPSGSVIIAGARDITERLQREDALRHAQLRLDTVLSHAPVVLFAIDRDGIFTYSEGVGLKPLGLAPGEVVGRSVRDIYADHPDILENVAHAIAGEEVRVTTQVGPLTFDTFYSPFVGLDGVPNGTIAIAVDVTSSFEVQQKLQRSLEEKEVLLREVHHRVKNNMQVMSSLLQMHSLRTADPEVQSVLDTVRERIGSMSLIHEQIYQTGQFAWIDIIDYARRLAGTIASSFGFDSGVAITFDGELALPLDSAIPCGLVLNELFVNAFKHGFPDGRRGTIALSASRQGSEARIVVADDGVGLPAGVDPACASTLGLRLVKLIAEKQLDGRIEIDRSSGTRISVLFPA